MTRKGYENTFRPKREDEKVPQTRQMMKRPRKGGREFVCRAIALRQSRSIIERGTEFHRDCLSMKKNQMYRRWVEKSQSRRENRRL